MMTKFFRWMSRAIPYIIWLIPSGGWVAWMIIARFDTRVVVWGPVVIILSSFLFIATRDNLQVWWGRRQSEETPQDGIEERIQSILDDTQQLAELLPAIGEAGLQVWKNSAVRVGEVERVYAFSRVISGFALCAPEKEIRGDQLRGTIENRIADILSAHMAVRELSINGQHAPVSEITQMHEAVLSMQLAHGKYNWKPLFWDDILEICKRELITIDETFDFGDSPFSSLLLVIRSRLQDGNIVRGGLILLDKKLPPLRKRLLALHELGHWRLHAAKVLPSIVQISADAQADFVIPVAMPHEAVERQADIFSLIGIFPTQALHWIETVEQRKLSDECLLEYLKNNLDAKRGEQIDQFLNAKKYCDLRARNYSKYIEKHFNIRLRQFVPNGPIKRQDIPSMKNIYASWAWSEIDENKLIIDLNQNFAGIIGESPIEIKQKKNLSDLAHNEMMQYLAIQWERRKKGLGGCYGFRYNDADPNKFRTAWIVTWPILDGNRFTGSFAVEMDSYNPMS